MSNFIYKLSKRGLCSELNSLLAFYESIINTDCSVFIDSSSSQYFQSLSIYDVFDFPDIFINHRLKDNKIILANQWNKGALRRYKTSLTINQCVDFFKYTSNFQEKINSCTKELNISKKFNCIQMRRGDKVGEALNIFKEKTGIVESKRYEFDHYYKNIKDPKSDVFVFTDDYRCVIEAKNYCYKNKLGNKIFTLTDPDDLGHSTDSILQNNYSFSNDDIIKFLTTIEISKQSNQFIGTASSNIYRYIKNTCSTKTKFISLD